MPNPFGNFNSIKVQLNVKCFNPRTHVGCDKNTEGCILVGEFQSTHPRRVRLVRLYLITTDFPFQSTHPRRVRLNSTLSKKENKSFNPRTHVGCDLKSFHRSSGTVLFQSTHPRRVRPRRSLFAKPWVRFQSTHPRRVRRNRSTAVLRLLRFNPRTHVGCDQSWCPSWLPVGVSIHAPT